MGKRNQERRRAKRRQHSAAEPRSGAGATSDDAFGEQPGWIPGSGLPPLGETVESIVVAALGVPAGAAGAALAAGAAALAGSLSGGPGGWGGVSLALLGIGERIVAGCWQGGWQPADLVRVVERGLAARHVRIAVDLVAAQGRRHAAATADPRWSVQVQELDAAVWWDDPRSYLDGVGERERLGRAATARCVLELFRLLTGLPQIPPVGPAPGDTAHRARRPEPPAGPEPRMLGRVRALLAQAESTNYPEEADAFTAKAQQLMARHSISAALLDAHTHRDGEPAARRIGVDNPYEAPKALLLDAVAAANRCRSVWSRPFGFSTVIGYPPDLDSVDMLYTSLLVQATTAMNRAGARRDSYGRSRTRAFRQSFLVAYATRIRQRLVEATESAVRAAAAGGPGAEGADAPGDPRLLPVLAARADAVADATDKMFPGLASHSLSGSDHEGWAHGTAAADNAVLHDRAGITAAR